MARSSMAEVVGGAQVAQAQGNEGDGSGSVMSLFISGVEKDLMSRIEEIGAGMRPPVRRNDLIIWILEEFSAGRIGPDGTADLR